LIPKDLGFDSVFVLPPCTNARDGFLEDSLVKYHYSLAYLFIEAVWEKMTFSCGFAPSLKSKYTQRNT